MPGNQETHHQDAAFSTVPHRGNIAGAPNMIWNLVPESQAIQPNITALEAGLKSAALMWFSLA
jgi:hypothetical protein